MVLHPVLVVAARMRQSRVRGPQGSCSGRLLEGFPCPALDWSECDVLFDIQLKVPTTEKPTVTVNFRKLLLNRCQKEFEKDKDDDEVFEKKQKEMDEAATVRETPVLIPPLHPVAPQLHKWEWGWWCLGAVLCLRM